MPTSQKMLTVSLLMFVFILPITLGFLGQSQEIRNQAAGISTPISPTLTPSPTVTPIPVPLPTQIIFEEIPFDSAPVVRPLDNTLPIYGNGYARGFKFQVPAGLKIEALAKELDLSSIGSYVRSEIYGPNQLKISDGGTRLDIDNTTAGYYYVIVIAYPNMTGDVQFQAFDREKASVSAKIFPVINGTPGSGLEVLRNLFLVSNSANTFFNLGREQVYFELKFPSTVSLLGQNQVRYFDKFRGEDYTTTLFLNSACDPSTLANSFNQGLPHYAADTNTVQSFTLTQIASDSVRLTNTGTSPYFPKGRYFSLIQGTIFTPTSAGTDNHWAMSTSSSTGKKADFNNSGLVDLNDYSILFREFLQTLPSYQADATCDDRVDLNDYSVMSGEFLRP